MPFDYYNLHQLYKFSRMPAPEYLNFSFVASDIAVLLLASMGKIIIPQ